MNFLNVLGFLFVVVGSLLVAAPAFWLVYALVKNVYRTAQRASVLIPDTYELAAQMSVAYGRTVSHEEAVAERRRLVADRDRESLWLIGGIVAIDYFGREANR